MKREEREKVYNKILTDKRYGFVEMRKKWVEELLELALCLQQGQNKGNTAPENLAKEMADVYISLEQMLYIFSNESEVKSLVDTVLQNLPVKLKLSND